MEKSQVTKINKVNKKTQLLNFFLDDRPPSAAKDEEREDMGMQ